MVFLVEFKLSSYVILKTQQIAHNLGAQVPCLCTNNTQCKVYIQYRERETVFDSDFVIVNCDCDSNLQLDAENRKDESTKHRLLIGFLNTICLD